MMRRRKRERFTRDAQGRFHPHLQEQERELLAELPGQAMGLLSGDDPSARRLYPVAYPDDEPAEKEYRSVMGDTLQARHRACLDTLATSVHDEAIDEAQMQQWMGAVEILRLVLGTQLDVSEDMAEIDALDPRAPQFAMYAYLSMLQGEIVDALATALPPAAEGD